jgi:hypothetical protein
VEQSRRRNAAYVVAGWVWLLAALVGVVYLADLVTRYGLPVLLLNGALLLAFPLLIGSVFLRGHRTLVVRINAAVAFVGGWLIVIALAWASPQAVVFIWIAAVALALVAFIATIRDRATSTERRDR